MGRLQNIVCFSTDFKYNTQSSLYIHSLLPLLYWQTSNWDVCLLLFLIHKLCPRPRKQICRLIIVNWIFLWLSECPARGCGQYLLISSKIYVPHMHFARHLRSSSTLADISRDSMNCLREYVRKALTRLCKVYEVSFVWKVAVLFVPMGMPV